MKSSDNYRLQLITHTCMIAPDCCTLKTLTTLLLFYITINLTFSFIVFMQLHDVFESLGCQMIGYTSQEGYLHEASKSVRGDKFCGLLCDAVNQEELTEGRVKNWVDQLKAEGILEGSASKSASAAAPVPAAAPAVIDVVASAPSELEENSRLLEESIAAHSSEVGNAFDPHFNPRSGVTMWTSRDGRSAYYTKETTSTFSP